MNLDLNGKKISLDIPTDTPLLRVLRDTLGLNGTSFDRAMTVNPDIVRRQMENAIVYGRIRIKRAPERRRRAGAAAAGSRGGQCDLSGDGQAAAQTADRQRGVAGGLS